MLICDANNMLQLSNYIIGLHNACDNDFQKKIFSNKTNIKFTFVVYTYVIFILLECQNQTVGNLCHIM